MTSQVVVLGAGYAGAGAVKRFQQEVDGEAELTWISKQDYHLVLHESHRVIREPSAESKVTIPVEEIKSPSTTFIQDSAVNVDVEEQRVELAAGESVSFDYLLVAIGTATAFYGIEGLKEHSLTLKSLEDAREIHRQIKEAASQASRSDPAKVIVGGAGLSGIQSCGEIAGFRDDHRAPIDVTLIEGLDSVFPGNPDSIQKALRERLLERDVEIMTGDFVSEVDDETVYVGGGEDEDPEELDYDVLLWTGGVTGHDELIDVDIEKDDRSNRIFAESDFTTSKEGVFAIGDSALIDQGEDNVAPPTAQAAWQAAEVAGANLARAVHGEALETWTHKDKGTVISVGEDAVAHDVQGIPIETFGGVPAQLLKKSIAARWIGDIASYGRAVDAWSNM